MDHVTPPDLYLCLSIYLYTMGHWIGGTISLGVFVTAAVLRSK